MSNVFLVLLFWFLMSWLKMVRLNYLLTRTVKNNVG